MITERQGWQCYFLFPNSLQDLVTNEQEKLRRSLLIFFFLKNLTYAFLHLVGSSNQLTGVIWQWRNKWVCEGKYDCSKQLLLLLTKWTTQCDVSLTCKDELVLTSYLSVFESLWFMLWSTTYGQFYYFSIYVVVLMPCWFWYSFHSLFSKGFNIHNYTLNS